MTRLRPCDQAVIDGRLSKARQFLEAAELLLERAEDERDVGDAYVTLCVHAGIAAADAICCIELGSHAQGEGHEQAVAHLARVRPDGSELATSLGRLLSAKTRAGYQHRPVTATARIQAGRAAERLVGAATDRKTRRRQRAG